SSASPATACSPPATPCPRISPAARSAPTSTTARSASSAPPPVPDPAFLQPSQPTPAASHIMTILHRQLAALGVIGLAAAAQAATLEKTDLKFGFIKLTDCAPLVIAKEKGFFTAEGLSVEVVAQPNWKTLLDNVI